MKRRSLGRSGLMATEIGLGCEHLQDQPLEVVERVVHAALDSGINIFDTFMSEPNVRTNLGLALKGRRQDVLLQGHIGAGWRDGQYFRTRDISECTHFFEDYMTRLQTDYVDIGMIHFVDTQDEVQAVLSSGMLEYALSLKEKGIIRAVGVGSHDPLAARAMIETGAVDVLMFSLNPAFDMLPADAELDALFDSASYTALDRFAIAPERLALYQACAAQGIGITVMKGLAAGLLLNAEKTPFGAPMSVYQCVQYALSRPAVASVLAGCRTEEEVKHAARFGRVSAAQRDYSEVLMQTPAFSMKGQCMYCNHCLPCPAHIDVAQVNKYLDMVLVSSKVPETVRAHYDALARRASDCIGCGQCESRCPFGVSGIERMKEARHVFGK